LTETAGRIIEILLQAFIREFSSGIGLLNLFAIFLIASIICGNFFLIYRAIKTGHSLAEINQYFRPNAKYWQAIALCIIWLTSCGVLVLPSAS